MSNHLPDLANVTPDALEPLIDHLAVRCDEMLAATKAALRRELSEAQARQLVTDAVAFNALAAQLGALAFNAAVHAMDDREGRH